VQILNALDCGATGVVVPHVASAAAARAIAQAAHYGRGGRGYAGSTRAAGYIGKGMADHLRDSGAQTAVIVQIEDVEAIAAIDEIAAVDGIDCLFVGRMDLTVALGCPGPDDPRVLDAVRRVCRAGRAARRAVGMFVPNVAEAATWLGAGANLFLLGSDHAFMIAGARALRADFALARKNAGC
jgi:2-keto-3-deoxy-L-rhamnonate aldolase RhmA